MGFKDLSVEIKYRSDLHDLPRDFLIPVLQKTTIYKRSVGFFSTSSLLRLSVGLFEMARKGGKIQLICSPKLNEEDIKAIDSGYRTREAVITEALNVGLTSPISYFEEERLNLIATLIADGMMDIKLAFMEMDTGINMYHEKIAIFEDEDGNKISFTGSLNDSENAFYDNFESVYTFCSWKDESQQQGVEEAENDFKRLWEDNTFKLKVIPFPQVIIEKLLTFRKDFVDYSIDDQEYDYTPFLKKKQVFRVPEKVDLRDYQKEAVSSWIKQEYRGIFSMSTGSGKSFTALACMVNLAEKLSEKLAVFIVCPYIHLVGQWEEDVMNWGCGPIIAHSKSPDRNWEEHLILAYKRFRKNSNPFICITTNDTFSGDKIQPIVKRFSKDQDILLIVDEAHNFGSDRLSACLPTNIKYRIALSATIRRYMDKKGTDRLFQYFGDECIVYDLDRAIQDKALVEYKYHPIPVFLTPDELQDYVKLTKELKKYLILENGKMKISRSGEWVVFKRSRLLAGAKNKMTLLKEIIAPLKNEKHMLIYCGATTNEDEETGEMSRQIDDVTTMLNRELGIKAHRFTAEEDLKERQNIKVFFQEGMYQAITAIKCLDEGVNIPSIQIAFIMSSSRNPKEFIQRRGRLLRKSPGKKYAIIYDFVTLPREFENVVYGDYEEDRSILIGELARIHEFGKLAGNPLEAESLKTKIMNAYDIFIDIEEETKALEDYYGDD